MSASAIHIGASAAALPRQPCVSHGAPPHLALGCARIGSVLTPMGRTDCLALIEAAYELGIRHFDTADIYGQGDSERFLGAALKGKRSQVVLASKAGQKPGAVWQVAGLFKGPLRWLAARHGGARRRGSDSRARPTHRCFEAPHLERALAGSLRRLDTDYLDIFYLHSPAPEVLEDDRLMQRLQALRTAGLFRQLGVSCDEPDTAWRAARHEAVDVVQFAHDGRPAAQALAAELRTRGKAAMVRGLMAGPPPQPPLEQRLREVVAHSVPAGIITGTVSLVHLRDNVQAFRRALDGARP